jgi:hypothetical protein
MVCVGKRDVDDIRTPYVTGCIVTLTLVSHARSFQDCTKGFCTNEGFWNGVIAGEAEHLAEL